MSPQKYNLIVVAHPDDEAIFFSGLILSNRQLPWKVICVTDGNADGRGHDRKLEFIESCKLLGVEFIEQWHYPDIFEQRLAVQDLIAKLKLETPNAVYTHNPIGEYAHPHHQDVSYAVSQSLDEFIIRCVSYNCYPDEVIKLTEDQYNKKCLLLNSIYRIETQSFVNFLPAQSSESFTFIEKSEIQAVYEYLAFDRDLDRQALNKFKWLFPVIEKYREPIRF